MYIEFTMTIFGQCHNVLNNKVYSNSTKKAFLKRNVLSRFLKLSTEGLDFTATGEGFHSCGVQTEKA